jgi:hypothetical protein
VGRFFSGGAFMECEPTDQTEPYCRFVVVVVVGEPRNIVNLLYTYIKNHEQIGGLVVMYFVGGFM